MYSVEDPELFNTTPELGMGYHFGVVRNSTSRSEEDEGVLVLNSELALTAGDVLDFERFRRWRLTQGVEAIAGVRLTLIMAPEPAPKRNIIPSNDTALFQSTFGRFVTNIERYEMRSRLHASPPFQFQTKTTEAFARFSAFRNDRRVLPNGSLLPGTYVTSERDAKFAPSGFAAVGRYALPNPIAAVFRVDIVVPAKTPGLVGTVLPAFGQSGGGVEIELTNGAPPGSVTGPMTVPEY